MSSFRALAAVAALSVIAIPGLAGARDVKHCGITIAAGKTGTLAKEIQCGWRCIADPTVSCTDPPLGQDPKCPLTGKDDCLPELITLEKNATLDLNGFTLKPVYQMPAVVCAPGRGRCTVRNGAIAGGKETPIVGNDKDLYLDDLTVTLFYSSIRTTGWVHASNLTLGGCDSSGVVGDAGVRAENVTLGDLCALASAKNVYVDGADVTGGLFADGTLRVQHATVEPYNHGLHGRDVYLRSSTVLPFPGSDVAGTQIFSDRRLVIRTSEVRGIQSGRKPQLVKSSCLESRRTDGTTTWGVCSED